MWLFVRERNTVVESLRMRRQYTPPKLTFFGSVKQLTQGSSGRRGDGRSSRRPSDLRAKENIVRVGCHPLGFGLYLFDYTPAFRDDHGWGRQFGVLAQEVERVMPEAVSLDADGYRRVDYALLGLAPAGAVSRGVSHPQACGPR
jgi:hypothetical protein